jgi:glycosyltransferase involved in cell wall biosynthesis
MGRIFPVKDYLLMVEVAREIAGVTDKIRFELAGDGPDTSKVAAAVERYRLGDSFRLLGPVEDLPGFYQGIDLYLNTSLHEGMPMTILEAMSYGIPVVAPNVGGLKEMLEDGKEGYLVNGREPEEFAKRCLHLYENRTLGLSMGAFGRKRVAEEFSNEIMARGYNFLYRQITGDSMTGAHP